MQTIDTLLGYVGRQVVIAVYGAGDDFAPVMLKGELHQGERGRLSGEAPEDYFGIGDQPAGLFLDRGRFVSGEYAEERLTIVLGGLVLTVDVEITAADTPGPDV